MEDSEVETFLVPANAKKSTLILGFFNTFDLVIFLIGVFFTLMLLLIVHTSEMGILILIILPALIVTTLVLPVPHYHNVMQLLSNIFNFFFQKRKYKWKGWGLLDEQLKSE